MQWESMNVRDHIPLEQGLRRPSCPRPRPWPRVRDHIPLEQGLRLTLLMCLNISTLSETIFH